MKPLAQRVEQYVKEDAKSLARLSLQKQLLVNFPNRRSVPLLSWLAIAIIRRQGGILDTRMSSTS